MVDYPKGTGTNVRPAHRPRLDSAAVRVVQAYRLHPDTVARIRYLADWRGISTGRVLDQLAAAAVPTVPAVGDSGGQPSTAVPRGVQKQRPKGSKSKAK